MADFVISQDRAEVLTVFTSLRDLHQYGRRELYKSGRRKLDGRHFLETGFFDRPVTAKYVKFVVKDATSEQAGKCFSSAAQIRLDRSGKNRRRQAD